MKNLGSMHLWFRGRITKGAWHLFENVDLVDGFITVKESFNKKSGLKRTKTDEDRKVEIPTWLGPVLAKEMIGKSQNDFILPRLEKWEKGEQSRELKQFLQDHGLPVIRFYDLRASWATALLSMGVPTQVVASMGGWKSLQVMRRYVRMAGIAIKGATKNFKL